jgi:CYTH domain-containing protein
MIEKERKFVLKGLPIGLEPLQISQGYLMFDGNKHLRVRVINNETAFLTFKTIHDSTIRTEYEYEIPLDDAVAMLNSTDMVVFKNRYKTTFEGNSVDIDIFDNGVSVVEIEFENELVNIPDYCGEEVTNDNRYSNINIAKNNKP